MPNWMKYKNQTIWVAVNKHHLFPEAFAKKDRWLLVSFILASHKWLKNGGFSDRQNELITVSPQRLTHLK
jgi:hypothetical protein